jgi:small-conductance mechanosensitive channel
MQGVLPWLLITKRQGTAMHCLIFRCYCHCPRPCTSTHIERCFSGLVLSLSRPYRPGDWINIEGGTEGQVIEMNWRATHVLTPRRDLAIVPNSTIAKSKILNVSFPSSIHGVTIAVVLSSKIPPASGTSVLELALLNSRTVLALPRPTVRVVPIDAAQRGPSQ